jgi:hypothetical protein
MLQYTLHWIPAGRTLLSSNRNAANFDVLLTVPLSIVLAINQINAQIFEE